MATWELYSPSDDIVFDSEEDPRRRSRRSAAWVLLRCRSHGRAR
jgi:hypothetical protein